METLVIKELNQRVLTLKLNRPEKRNAFSPELVRVLKYEIETALNDNGIRAIIIEGNGPSFSAGADLTYISEIRNNTFEENLADSKALQVLYDLIFKGGKPFIAKVKGHALAGGCGLASICDFAFATPESKFGYTETRIGFVPALVSVYIQGLVPHRKLREWLLSGAIFSAQEAVDNYLINKVISEDTIDEYVASFSQNLIENNSGDSIALTKTLLAETMGKSLEDALQNASETNAKARATKDCIRGVDAFLNKESIKW